MLPRYCFKKISSTLLHCSSLIDKWSFSIMTACFSKFKRSRQKIKYTSRQNFTNPTSTPVNFWQAVTSRECNSKSSKLTSTYFDPNQILFSTVGWIVPVGRWWPRGKHWSALGGRSRALRQPHKGPWAPEQVWGLTGSHNHLLTQCRSLKPGSPYDCVLFRCLSLGWEQGGKIYTNTHTVLSCAHA